MQSFSWYQLSPGLALLCSCCHIDCKLKPWLKFINIYTSKRVLRLYQKWWKLETMLFGQHSYGFSLTSSPSTMQYSVIPKFHTKSNKFWMCFSVFGRGFVKYFNCDELFWGEKGTGGGFGCFWVILLGSVFLINQQKGSWRYQIWLC